MLSNELVVISVLLLIFIIKHQTHSLILQPFYWNQTTFRPYQDGSLIFEVRLGDVMDLICPFYNEQQSYLTSELEKYDIYRVTKNEYDMCNIDQFSSDPMTRLVITCNSPYDVMKYTLNFRSYLPIPNGLEFRSNQTYYFLSTSSNHQQCSKLKIIVHDYNRVLLSTSTVSNVNDQERKSLLFSRYSHYRHGSSSSSIDKSIDYSDNHWPFSHIIKAQRQSDPYSIKWITEGTHHVRDSADQTTKAMDASMSPSNIISFALSSSSSKLSISLLILFLLLSLS